MALVYGTSYSFQLHLDGCVWPPLPWCFEYSCLRVSGPLSLFRFLCSHVTLSLSVLTLHPGVFLFLSLVWAGVAPSPFVPVQSASEGRGV